MGFVLFYLFIYLFIYLFFFFGGGGGWMGRWATTYVNPGTHALNAP